MKVDLKSSVQKQGKTVTQIVTGLHGTKKTFRGIKTETIEQGEFTHFETGDGRLVLINTKNILWVEVFKEESNLIIAHHPTNCQKPNCEICPFTI